MRLGLFTALALGLLLPAAVGAQSLSPIGGAGGDSYTVSVSPQYPAPSSQATLSFVSSTLDLANATLSVSVAGKDIYQGSVHPVAIALGKTGSITNVRVTVTSNGTPSIQTISIQPQDVVLVAEPISSAPPLYIGKPSVPPGGDIRVVAIANMRDASGRSKRS